MVLPSTMLLPAERNTPLPLCANPMLFLLTVLFDARTVPLALATIPALEFEEDTEFDTTSREWATKLGPAENPVALWVT